MTHLAGRHVPAHSQQTPSQARVDGIDLSLLLPMSRHLFRNVPTIQRGLLTRLPH